MAIEPDWAARAKSGQYFVGIIDGTGPASDDAKGKLAYDTAMAQGFCRQLSTIFGKKSLYRRGPSVSGSGLGVAVADIVAAVEKLTDHAIILVGYSRGALGVLMAAQQLKNKKINIYALVLLDAVDRYGDSFPYKSIPNNVMASFRAYRSLNAKIILKYEGTMGSAPPAWPGWAKTIVDVLAPSNPVRPSFSSTAFGVERGGLYDASMKSQHEIKYYVGTHGAMGGVGYTWVVEDETCQAALTRDLGLWLSERIDINVKLNAGTDPALTAPRFTGIVRALIAAGAAPLDIKFMSMAKFDSLIYDTKEVFRNLFW